MMRANLIVIIDLITKYTIQSKNKIRSNISSFSKGRLIFTARVVNQNPSHSLNLAR